ncbi:hypothetical protein MXB_4952 [Myxobolus squamalis]|nr:hypothetical protein MXB_4952 [Myxobolus squamalis]
MLQRHWKGDIDNKMHQALIWSTDETFSLLQYKGRAFIDATFRVALTLFIQCLIVMGRNSIFHAHIHLKLQKVSTCIAKFFTSL